MNGNGWFKCWRSAEADELQRRHPNAFLLLCQIARRARWKDCAITKLKVGEAFIGDFKEAGLRSEMIYRGAKKVLLDAQIVTFRATNKGTVATLTNSMIFDLSEESVNDQDNGPITDKQRASNEPITTNKKERRIDGKNSSIGFGESGFLNITSEHFKTWEENSQSGVDIDFELEKAEAWLRENKKPKSYALFLLGWMKRAKPSGVDSIRPANNTADNFELKNFSADQLGLKR